MPLGADALRLWLNNATTIFMLTATLLAVFRRYVTQPALSGLAIAYINNAQCAASTLSRLTLQTP